MENNWREYTLDDLCHKITDGSHQSPKAFDGGIPMYSVKDMNDHGFNRAGAKTISVQDYEKLLAQGCQPEVNDILIAKDGSVMKHVFKVDINERCALLSSIAILKPKEELIDPDFLVFSILNPIVKNNILSNYVSGSGVPRIVLKDFKKVVVRVPNLAIQKEIAKIILNQNQKILLNKQINQTLEQMAQALFKSWFVDFDPVFDNALASGMAVNDFPEALQKKALARQQQRQQEPSADKEREAKALPEAASASEELAKRFPSEFEQTDEPSIGINGWIPKGWKVSKFKEAIDQYIDNRGKTPPLCEEGIPLIEVKHLPENTNFPILNSEKQVTEDTFKTWFRKHVEEKDILISTVGTIGRTSFVKNTRLGIAQNLLGLRFGKIVNPEYMFYTIKGHKFQHDVDARLVTTVQASIKRKDLDTIDILVPSHCIQNKFSELVGTYIDSQYCKSQAISGLELIRDTLLPKLISGELTIPKAKDCA